MKFNKKELFYYCSNELRYKKLNKIKVLIPSLALLVIFLLLIPINESLIGNVSNHDNFESDISVININDTLNDFSEDKLIDMLISLNIKFPHIVLAQAKLESGNYSSKIFRENHNLVGIKEARVRVHT